MEKQYQICWVGGWVGACVRVWVCVGVGVCVCMCVCVYSCLSHQACMQHIILLPVAYLALEYFSTRHNCSPAASFANCIMTLYLLKVHLQMFLHIPITQNC